MRRTTAIVSMVLLVTACAGSGSGSEQTDDPAGESQTTEGGLMEIVSPAFDDGQAIPVRYTCDGEDVAPPLVVSGIPESAVSLVLVMDDPDAPVGVWDHWVAFDIPLDGSGSFEFPEGIGSIGVDGTNSWGRGGYGGPCPPSGTHRYFFAVYVLDTTLGIAAGSDKDTVLGAADGHVVAEAVLMGTYAR